MTLDFRLLMGSSSHSKKNPPKPELYGQPEGPGMEDAWNPYRVVDPKPRGRASAFLLKRSTLL